MYSLYGNQIPLRCPACDKLASTSAISSRAGRRSASEQDSVMEYGLYRSATRFELPQHVETARTCLRQVGNQVCDQVCDLLRLNIITLSRSQTWFPTCRRQVRAVSTCQDRSNLVADRFMSYSITLSSSLAGLRPAWSQTC